MESYIIAVKNAATEQELNMGYRAIIFQFSDH
jgi:hypothetical protein